MFASSNLRKFAREWDDKVATAFFCGSASGGGVDVATNQRLKLAQLSVQWRNDPNMNGTPAFLDAAITKADGLDIKLASCRP